MARIFLAIPIPCEIKDQIRSVKSANTQLENMRWTPEENLHLTIYFIGQVPNDLSATVTAQIMKLMKDQVAFVLEFDRLFLTPLSKPEMIWLRMKHSDNFKTLFYRVHSELVQFIPFLKIDHPDPVPHITLARFKSSFDAKRISFPAMDRFKLDINGCELWESVKTKEGTKYERMQEFHFLK